MKINLGSGNRPVEGYVNIDSQDRVHPDMVLDITKGFPFDDNSVDEIRAIDVLEHIPILSTNFVMEEAWRVLKPGCLFVTHTPDAEYGQGAFMDPTHINFWVEGRFAYYCNPDYRKYYGTKANFEIEYFKNPK
jgi:predicted SAM-dependent methyltransferase